MSLLELAEKPKIEAPIITIVGFPGAGKTSLAGLFPDAIFIQAENAQTVFSSWDDANKPMLLPQLKASKKDQGIRTSQDLRDYFIALLKEDHKYKTVVVDSVSSLNTMFEEEVTMYDQHNADSIANAAGGFHKGFDVVAGMHSTVLRAAEALQKKGVAVIFLCHSGTVKMKNQPDEAKDYTAFSLAMHEKSRALYVAKSDAVLYLKQEQYVTGGETDKKGSQTKAARVQTTEERILITASDGVIGYIDAKNRYNLENKIQVAKGTNPLLSLIPFFKQTNKPKGK